MARRAGGSAEAQREAIEAEALRNGNGVTQNLARGLTRLQDALERAGEPPVLEAAAATARVPAGGDLAGAIAAAPSGAVIALEAGAYALPRRLVLKKELTLRGAGWPATTLALGGGVRVEGGGRLCLSGLDVRWASRRAGTLVAIEFGGAYLDRCRLGGALALLGREPGARWLETRRSGRGVLLSIGELHAAGEPLRGQRGGGRRRAPRRRRVDAQLRLRRQRAPGCWCAAP